jgi:penicillin amidase
MDGRVGFDDMPHLVNPHTGFLATANTPPTPQGSGACLSVDWLDGYRLARITEALASRDDWDLASVQALQMDQLSLPWRELRDIVVAIAPDTADARAALELLTTWDGIVDAASPAASVFEYFLAEMAQRIVRAKGPRAAEWALGKGFTPLVPHAMIAVRRVGHLVRLVRTQPEGWFDRSWPEEMADALGCAVRALRTRRGDTADQWAWGKVRPVTLRHVLGDQRPLDRVFNLGPFAWGGDTNTIGQAATDCLEPTANDVRRSPGSAGEAVAV